MNFHFLCVGRKVDELRALLYLVIHGFLWAASLSSIYEIVRNMIIFIVDN